jgi:hypothetical protein
MWWSVLLACASHDDPAADRPALLDPVARAARISVALRGVRPSEAELAAIQRDPWALDGLVDQWLEDPRFGDTVRDLHAEVLLLRDDNQPILPGAGPLEGTTDGQRFDATQETPLRFVEHVVTEDRPYTEIVTADYAWTNRILAAMEGMPFDLVGPEYQESRHVDGRPEAGLLSSTGVWLRWYTNLSGKHRHRANFVTKALLCDEIGARDMPVIANFDPTDAQGVADALATNPACLGCHQDLDPLAAYFWGFPFQVTGADVLAGGYPLKIWNQKDTGLWEYYGLPAPGYYGHAGTDLRDLGASIADDPRFAQCAAEQAWWYLAESEGQDPPADLLESATETLVDSGFDWRRMVEAIVTSDDFLRADRRPLQLRTEALSRQIESVTGFRWRFPNARWGLVDALGNSGEGARDLGGGMDQFNLEQPSFAPSAANLLTFDAVAQLAADQAVADGVVLDPALEDEAAVRAQLVSLLARISSRLVDPDDAQVNALYDLFVAARARYPTADAWSLTLRALLTDPTSLTY